MSPHKFMHKTLLIDLIKQLFSSFVIFITGFKKIELQKMEFYKMACVSWSAQRDTLRNTKNHSKLNHHQYQNKP